MNPPGEWDTYDIIYTTPTFKEDGTYRTRPMVTVIQNGDYYKIILTYWEQQNILVFPKLKSM
jgi:hypothetical protein